MTGAGSLRTKHWSVKAGATMMPMSSGGVYGTPAQELAIRLLLISGALCQIIFEPCPSSKWTSDPLERVPCHARVRLTDTEKGRRAN